MEISKHGQTAALAKDYDQEKFSLLIRDLTNQTERGLVEGAQDVDGVGQC